METEDECKSCEVLREWLEEERTKRDYYERLFLSRIGAIQPEAQEEVDYSQFPSINRITTLSSLRQRARTAIRNRKPVLDETALQNEKTEAEIIFEESLINGQKIS